ncbi:lycopene cyclase domain-containing protein [Arthrobacter sp. LAPM80]|uniref:lycopene cyclase domain-containing protein n=1 Tax=Arthrobacter sp. LAPM80 TaxID=3141788 RepID=UPI00398AC551
MSFIELNVIFVAVAVVVLLPTLPWRGSVAGGMGRVVVPLVATAVVMVALTAVFDNIMISSGLFDYAGHTLNGARVGLAPIEDFAYPVAGALLLPGLWLLFTRGRKT